MANGRALPLPVDLVAVRSERDAGTGSAKNSRRLVYQNNSLEEKLLRSEETLRLACEGAEVGIWRRDVASGQELWSEKYYELYGFTRDTEACFENWLSAVHPEDREEILQDHRRMLDLKLTQLQNEFRILHPSGVRWIREIGRNFYDERGNQTEMIGIALDITRQKQWEQELRSICDRKDEFLSMLAHELRNSLSAITIAQTLSDRGAKSREWTDSLIKKKTQLLTRLVGDLLDLARLPKGNIELQRQPIDVVSVVTDLAEQARLIFADKCQKISLQSLEDSVVLNVDPVRFEQMIINVLHNACKYTPAHGDIGIHVSQSPDWVSIAICDSGIGIAPQSLAAVFDLYTRLSSDSRRGASAETPSTAGLGIGLAIVKQLIDMHGGTVQAFSEGLGKGSQFVLRFPR